MLYERWRKIAWENRKTVALRDMSSGEEWTFEKLALSAEKSSPGLENFVYPQGISAQFIFLVLGAWRSGGVLWPVDNLEDLPIVPKPSANIIHIKTTSGSTGRVRVIAFSAGQLIADAENIVATMRLRPEWPNLGVISLAHSYGFSSLVLPLLLHGIPLILVRAALPEALRHTLKSCGECTLPGVPALWRGWHEANVLTANVRLAISAGAPLPLPLERGIFERSGIKVHNFYGASECGGIAYDATDQPRTDADCVGTPMQNVDLSLNEEDCLRVRSQAVAETYWPTSSPKLGGGCFQSNDLAELSDGQVYLRGRLGDMINVAGRKVAPETIERVLQCHPQVRECLVFGVRSTASERADTIVACVAIKAPLSVDSLRQFLLQHLHPWQLPREWHFEELEPNARGKISRAEWRARYLAGRP